MDTRVSAGKNKTNEEEGVSFKLKNPPTGNNDVLNGDGNHFNIGIQGYK